VKRIDCRLNESICACFLNSALLGRRIRFWNTLTQQPLQCVDTGSQVCNLAWSKHSSELVSTHGYSQNQILLWKYPSLTQVAKLTGHSYRVLYLVSRFFSHEAVTPCKMYFAFCKYAVLRPLVRASRLWHPAMSSTVFPCCYWNPVTFFSNVCN